MQAEVHAGACKPVLPETSLPLHIGHHYLHAQFFGGKAQRRRCQVAACAVLVQAWRHLTLCAPSPIRQAVACRVLTGLRPSSGESVSAPKLTDPTLRSAAQGEPRIQSQPKHIRGWATGAAGLSLRTSLTPDAVHQSQRSGRT